MALVADPDEVIDHLPPRAAGAGGGLAGAEPAGVIARPVLSVVDLADDGVIGVIDDWLWSALGRGVRRDEV